MSNLNRAIRHKRYRITSINDVKLIVQFDNGLQAKLVVMNGSINGICGYLDESQEIDTEITIGEILPNSKLVAPNMELSLGRLVIRGVSTENNKSILRFSLIDSKLPLDGKLSKYIDIEQGEIIPFKLELSPQKFNVATFKESDEYSYDIFTKCRKFGFLFSEWKNSPKFQYHSIRIPSKGTRIKLRGTRKQNRNDFISMGSNDYYGMASNQEVILAAKKAIDDYGFGSTGSPVTTGLTALHEELSFKISNLLRKEKTLLFNSGYAANIGTIEGLVRTNDLAVADYLVHASLQDGMKMSSGTHRYYKHNDLSHLQSILTNTREKHEGCLVITEGIFSMDGDQGKLDHIIPIAKQHNARILVDEAHSFGVVGANGLGSCEHFGVLDQVDIVMGTFSKVCGGIGGFISASKEVIDWLNLFARSHVFSVSIPPSTAAAALKALELIFADNSYVDRLQKNIKHFVEGLHSIGYTKISKNHCSSVVPVIIGDEEILGKINKLLYDAGIFVIPIVYPGVAPGECRFRFTMTSELTFSDIDYVISQLESAMKTVGFEPTKN